MGKKKKQSRRQTSKKKQTKKTVSRQTAVREWIGSILFAFVAMLFVHTFFFQPFVVPTPSMASTVLPGDYLIVSKLHYGPHTPRTLGIPYTDFYLKGLALPAFRIPGFSQVNRGDVVVFNFPPEQEHPIDKRQPYLKRAIGLPGEALEIRDKQVFINNQAIPDFEGQQKFWDIYKKDPRVILSAQKLKSIGVEEIITLRDQSRVRVIASAPVIAQIASWPYVERVEAFIDRNRTTHSQLFPSFLPQTTDNYGPVIVPQKGETVELTAENWAIYGQMIQDHEPNEITLTSENTFLVNETPAATYTFTQDYYFMMGDNRDNSLDSRFWGFVPENHIMGKAVARFYSWDKEAGWPRFERMFERIQ